MSRDAIDKISGIVGENRQFGKILANLYAKSGPNPEKFVASCQLVKKSLEPDRLQRVYQVLASDRPKKKRIALDLDLDVDADWGPPEQTVEKKTVPTEGAPIRFKKLKKTEAQRLRDFHAAVRSESPGIQGEDEAAARANSPDRWNAADATAWSTVPGESSASETTTLINTPTSTIVDFDGDDEQTDVEEDRAWYGVEDYYNDFNDDELETKTKEQVVRHNKEAMHRARKKKRSQQNDLWIKNQLDKSLGRHHELNIDAEEVESDSEEEEMRFNIAVDHQVPPFLDAANVALTSQRTAIDPVREPDGDLAFMARQGSLLVREKRHENEKAKHDQQNLSDTKLGKVMGIQETDAQEPHPEQDNGDVDSEDEEPLEIGAQRRSLPVFTVKDDLVKAILENQVLVIVGETGSGKTTQIPQYLRDAGLVKNGMIGVTQPRRVAAMSVAKRVSEEVGCRLGDEVGYSIRFEDHTSDLTEIKFLTEGILLRECLADDTLSKYSCIIIDEAHERALNTDIALGLFKSILGKRRDLKLIITSATINADRFATFFGHAPQFDIPGRTFPVEILSNAYNVTDYVESCIQQVLKIHSQSQSKGDILCFMTGQEDIDVCCQVLEERLKEFDQMEPLKVLPIYSTLPSDLQNKIFAKSKHRKCIVATNIAETSLTVDGIKFVIDCGLSKLMIYNAKLNMDTLQICPISLAQANQRSGRAGRTGPGVCFRLYTLTQQEKEMYPQPIPEIQRTNLSNTLLLLKNLGIKDLMRFPLMDPPPAELITSSLYELWLLGALDNFGDLTDLGRTMSKFPLEASLSKLLIKSTEFGCSNEIITIVAMLSVPQIFIRSKERQSESDQARLKFQIAESDHLTLLNVFNLFMRNANSKWCNKNYLNFKSLKRANDIRLQIMSIFQKLKIPVQSAGYNNDEVVLKCLCSTFYLNGAKFQKFGQFMNLKNGLTVLLHPTSALFSMNDFPSYIIYHEILLTSKEYMNYVSIVKPEWLLEFGANYYTLRNNVEGFDNSRHVSFIEQLKVDAAGYSQHAQGNVTERAKAPEVKAVSKFRSRRGF